MIKTKGRLLLRAYQGQGVLQHADGTRVPCSFSAQQDHHGTVSLDCSSEPGLPPLSWALARSRTGVESLRLEGTTTDGRAVVAQGRMLAHPGLMSMGEISSHLKLELTGRSSLEVGAIGEADEWRFSVACLKFNSLQRSESGRTELTLTIGDEAAHIVLIGDDDEIDSQLVGQSAIRITGEIILPARVPFDVARARATALCALLSIADGTTVAWVCCDLVSVSTGARVYSYHFPAVTRPYNGALPLIDPNTPGELPRFLEISYPAFEANREMRSLQRIASALGDSRTTGFLESRCLTVLSVIEFILEDDATMHAEATTLNPCVFTKRLAGLTKDAAEVVRRILPELSEDQVLKMAQHVQGWNFTNLRTRLSRTAERLKVTLDKNEIQPFMKIRNDMVHRLRFQPGHEPLDDFTAVLSILDRLLMGLLGYAGPYIDARTITRVER